MKTHDEEIVQWKKKRKDGRRVSFHEEVTEHIIPARENKGQELFEELPYLSFDDVQGEQYEEFLKVFASIVLNFYLRFT